jgi:Helix-turn-helix domain
MFARHRRSRQKTFIPIGISLDRNGKARLLAAARALSRRQRSQHHDGPTISRAAVDVLAALVWHHNASTGFCYPSYERLSQAAACSRSTVALCLKALEWSGLLTWAHRIDRVREQCIDLFGRQSWRWKVVRRSNSYVLRDPLRSESDFRTGTRTSLKTSSDRAPARELVGPLAEVLTSLGARIKGRKDCIEQGVGGIACAPGTAA